MPQAAKSIINLNIMWMWQYKLYGVKTGYTGEEGYEICCKNEDAVRLWELLLKAEKTTD